MSTPEKKPKTVEDEIKETIQANAKVLVRTNAHVGDLIKIIEMKSDPQYNGKDGTVTRVDYLGQLHGTWGGLAVIPSEDKYEIILPADINGPIEHMMKD